MTAQEIRLTFPAYAPILMADGTYAKPTVRWLTDVFWPYFQRERFDKGLHKWERKNDCDNFSRAYAQSAADCHALTSGNADEGLALGEFWFIGAQGAHAINVAFTDQGKVYIEPQTGQLLTLTHKEEMSCIGCRF